MILPNCVKKNVFTQTLTLLKKQDITLSLRLLDALESGITPQEFTEQIIEAEDDIDRPVVVHYCTDTISEVFSRVTKLIRLGGDLLESPDNILSLDYSGPIEELLSFHKVFVDKKGYLDRERTKVFYISYKFNSNSQAKCYLLAKNPDEALSLLDEEFRNFHPEIKQKSLNEISIVNSKDFDNTKHNAEHIFDVAAKGKILVEVV